MATSKPGRVLFCGATAAAAALRDKAKKGLGGDLPNLAGVHVLGGPLLGVPVVSVASGSASSHQVALTAAGEVYTWGLGTSGQLGHGDKATRNAPTLVTALAGHKSHTLVVTSSGECFAFGSNKHGQLGTGKYSKPKDGVEDGSALPLPCATPPGVASVAAGAEFSLFLCSDGVLLSCGLPQHGVLGHGTDHEYNSADGSVKLVYAPQPTPKAVASFASAGLKVAKVAAGHAHCVAIDDKGHVWTWGNGNYGCLGHKEQKDEFVPRQVFIPGGDRNACPADAVVAASATASFVTAGQGQPYFWGKTKTNGPNQMFPVPFMDLSGWHLASFAAGATTFACCSVSEPGAVTWGGASFGELGYGDNGPKTSANPKRVDALAGVQILAVAAGTGNTYFLADEASGVSKLPVWAPPPDGPAPPPAAPGGVGKRKAAAVAREEEYAEDDEEEEEAPVKVKGKGKGRKA